MAQPDMFPNSLTKQKVSCYVAARGTAGDTSVAPLVVFDRDVWILRVDFIPQAAITANGTNFFTWTVQDRAAAGTGTTSLGARAWSATNSVAFVDENIVNKEQNPYKLAAGRALAVARSVGSAGLASPEAQFIVTYAEVDTTMQ